MGGVDGSAGDGDLALSPMGLPNQGGLVLVSGPSRSGKSRWAEHLADRSGLPVTYLATGGERPGDASWQQRLLLHRQRRPQHWTTLEVGGDLDPVLEAYGSSHSSPAGLGQGLGETHPPHGAPQGFETPDRAPNQAPNRAPIGQVLLIDSLGTWLAHHLALEEAAWLQRQERLLRALSQQRSPVVLVCEEVGWGLVPPTAIGGLFRDRSGSLQQRLMQQAAAAWLVVQGRALNLMALGEAVPPVQSNHPSPGPEAPAQANADSSP